LDKLKKEPQPFVIIFGLTVTFDLSASLCPTNDHVNQFTAIIILCSTVTKLLIRWRYLTCDSQVAS